MSNAAPPSRELKIDVDHRGRAVVVTLSGSAHMNTSAELGDQLVELIDEQVRLLVLDLSQLTFISSMGLGGIIAAHLRCCRQGAVLQLVRPMPAIQELLAITRLTNLFSVYDSVDEAMASG